MTVTLGGIAGLLAALAFAYLVIRLAGLIGQASKILQETQVSLRTTTDNVQPTLIEMTRSVSLTNDQLARVDTITRGASEITANASALMSLFAATLGSPLIKVAAYSYGARTALAALRNKPSDAGVSGRRASAQREVELRQALGDLDGRSMPSAPGREILHNPTRERAHRDTPRERAR